MMGSAPRRLVTGILAGMAAVFTATSAFGFVSPRLKPTAPGPSYLSQGDHDALLNVAAALKSKHFTQARSNMAGVTNPIARSLGDWMYFMAEDPHVRLDDADAFLDAHDDWPATSRIQAFVENSIPSNAPSATVLSFFDTRDPVTGDGKVQLARALFAKGDEEAGAIYLRDAWVNNNFTVSKERAILSSFKTRLSKEDHAARVDRLLWARQVTNARRIFSRLSSHERKKAQARAALILGASSAPSLYKKLSKDDQLDSGVLLAAVRYYRRTDNEQYALSLASKSPKNPEELRNSRRWWYERQLLMRAALKQGRFADAYIAASHHGLEPGSDFAEAEFNAGWIALRFLNKPERAETHFLALASAVGTPISQSRAFYWLGRTAAARKDPDLAAAYYQSAAKHYYSYYGQLAAEELGGAALQKRFPTPMRATPEDKARFGSRSTVAALRMLSDLNLSYEFMVFSYHVDDELDRPGEYLELASLANGEGAPHLTVRAGKVAVRRNAFTPEVAYPVVFVPEEAKHFIAPEIILGLSRQESEFNPRAYSHAGARGVMQLLPSTAQITARKEGMPYRRSALLDDPVYNMTIGSAHLSHLLGRFDGSLILTFAGYNAGASRSDQWISDYGDPRLDGVDPVDWVELIPFSETRNYVQRVLENMQVYRGRLNNTPIPGRLSADLEQGGARHRVAKEASIPSHRLNSLSRDFSLAQLPPLPPATAQRAADYKLKLASMITPITNARVQSVDAISFEQALTSPAPPAIKRSRKLQPRVTTPQKTAEAQVKIKSDQTAALTMTAEPQPLVVRETILITTIAGVKNISEIKKSGVNKMSAHDITSSVSPPKTPANELTPSPSINRPAPPPLTFMELSDAPKPLTQKPTPIVIQESIARLYHTPSTVLDGSPDAHTRSFPDEVKTFEGLPVSPGEGNATNQ
jgi:peptidoglycan lytic transglycosylase